MPSSAQGMTAKSWQPYWPILAPLLIRTFQLALPQTHFQPDEFYQSLEPPHWLVFGYGHLTWEWRDLPGSAGAAAAAGLGGPGVEGVRWGMDDWSGWGARWYEEIVVRGRMRGWIWPGVFVGVYKALQVLGREDLVAIAPRLIGVLVAAMTDYGTYRLASKLLGPGAGPTALFLSLTSLFNAHALPRLLSTSPETLLGVWALVYFPLPPPDAPRRVVVGKEKIVVAGDMKQVRHAEDTDGAKVEERAQEGADVKRVGKVGDYDYTMMDRIAHPEQAGPESIIVATTLATLAICIRPTTLPFWAFLGTDYAIRRHSFRGMASAILAAICTLAFSTYIDYTLTGRLVFPVLTFAHYNLFNPIAAFYGATDITYHLVQTIPILTFPFILPFLRGFLANMLPPQLHAWGLDKYDRPAGLRIVSRASAFAIAALSLSTHSEWRFLHPFLPIFVILVISPLSVAYTPTIIGAYRLTDCMRQYVRLSKLHYYGALLALLPYLYLMVHGRAQVEVMNALRRGDVGEVRRIVALMPCHSTPWQSHLHMDVPGWFLTCEPPIGMDREKHITQQQVFYADPEAYMQNTFPSPPLSDGKWLEPPSHVLLFGHILAFIGEELAEKGYEEVWYAWNGFDILQDEVERRGSVRVWRLQDQAQTA